MRIVLIILSFSFQFALNYIYAQGYCDTRYNYVWIMGGIDLDTVIDKYGGCEINFNTTPVSYTYHPKFIDLPFQNASICSKNGALLCYSNGCSIMNAHDTEVVNGDSINPGEIYDILCPFDGYIGHQNMFILPSPSDTNQYYAFYIDKAFDHKPNAPFLVRSENIFYSTIDFSENINGEVIARNQLIVHDTGLIGSPMTAVRHDNGIDWWIITPDRWSNRFFTIKLDDSGPAFSYVQYIGEATNPNAPGGQGKFNPDGTKFAWYHPLNGLFLYDFNRESGQLSNFNKIEIPPVDFITGGCEFSPSGRFLYINQDTCLFQLDMEAPNLQESLMKIASYDGFKEPLPTTFFMMERTPDKKILMNVLNGSQYLHVIQEPDKKGIDCRFEQHAIKLPTVNNFTLPHFPNYRLGAIEDPLCDSLMVNADGWNNSIETDIHISPNPANDFIILESNEEIASFKIMDISGTVVKVENPLDGSDYRIDISTLVPGMYILQAVTTDYQITSSKFIIVR